MPLINAMRELARLAGWSEELFDVSLSAYLEAGSLTPGQREELATMTPEQRFAWVRERHLPVDAMPMPSLDLHAHGYLPGQPFVRVPRESEVGDE